MRYFLKSMPFKPLETFFRSALALGAVFLAMCALVDLVTAAASESDEEELKKALGPYFNVCMDIGKQFAYCLLTSKYGPLNPRGERYDCSHADLTPAGFIARSSLPLDYRAACETAITPKGPSYLEELSDERSFAPC